MIRRWRARRARRLTLRMAVWVGIPDLTTAEVKRLAAMRSADVSPIKAAIRIEASRARRRIGERSGMFALDATLPHGRRRS